MLCFGQGGRVPCLKVLIVQDADGVRDMQREARVLAALREVLGLPPLVSLHAAGLVVTYHSPLTLQHLVERPSPLEVVVESLLHLGQTLANVHAEGFTHNDVKPENVSVAVAADGRMAVTLLDLSLATPTGHIPLEFLYMKTDDKAEWARVEVLWQRRHAGYVSELYHGGPSSPSSDAFSFVFTARAVISILPRSPTALLTSLQESMSSVESRLSMRALLDLLAGTLAARRR